jgi:hypothetical protein
MHILVTPSVDVAEFSSRPYQSGMAVLDGRRRTGRKAVGGWHADPSCAVLDLGVHGFDIEGALDTQIVDSEPAVGPRPTEEW